MRTKSNAILCNDLFAVCCYCSYVLDVSFRLFLVALLSMMIANISIYFFFLILFYYKWIYTHNLTQHANTRFDFYFDTILFLSFAVVAAAGWLLLHCYTATHTHTHYCLSLFLYSLAISSIYFFFALSTCWIHELLSKLVYVTKNFSVYFVSGFNEISVEYSDFVRYFTLISEYRLLLLTSFLTQFSFAFVCMCCWRE